MDLKLNDDDTSLRWAKYQEIKNASFIHDNILLFGGDNSLTFVNLSDGSSNSQSVTGNIGNGVTCFVGHKLYGIFAFSGACISPKIVLCSYPDFKQISCFQRSDSAPYLTMKFSETEHLIAVAGLPKYELEIWNWRTSKLLAVEQMDIQMDHQVLRVSHSLPLTITQYNPDDGNMNFWEVHTSVDTAKLIKRKIKCPFKDASGPFQMCYGIDGCIFFMNNKSVVYQIYPTSNKCNQIIVASSEVEDISTHINWYKGGLVIACDGYLRYFKKIVKDWVEQWNISSSSAITSTFCYNMELLLVACIDRNLMKLIDDSDASPPKLEMVTQFDTAIKYLAIINPAGKFVATVNSSNDFCVVEVATDKKVSKIVLDNISAMVAHPKLPIVAYGNALGYLYSLSLSEPVQPKYLSKFYLTTRCIKSLNYSSNGRTIVAYTSDNNIFVAQYLAGGKMYVTNQIPLATKLLHLTVNDNSIETHITALCVTTNDATKMISSDQLLHITVVGGNCTTNEINLSNDYTSIEYLNDGLDKFLAVPFKKTEFEIITLTRSKRFEIATTIRTPHLLKYFQVQIYSKFFVTFGIDGLVNVWDSNTFQVITSFFPHNKRFGGVMRCVVDANLRFFITLGSSNNLMCTDLSNKFHKSTKEALQTDTNLADFKKTMDVDLSPKGEEKTWLQQKLESEMEQERKNFQTDRQLLLEDLEKIKEKLRKLIDENETVPSNTKLDINEFNLNAEATDTFLEEAQQDRLEKEAYLTQFCVSQSKITELILASTWDPIDVKGTTLRGVFTKLKVENYALLKASENIENDLARTILYRKAENLVSQDDIFEPWIPKTTSQLEIGLSKLPGYKRDKIGEINYNDNDQVEQQPNSNYILPLSGTSSHIYIRPFPYRYNQMEVVTYQQMYAETVMGFHDILALRKYFNKIFDKMKKTKDYEINLVRERNQRLRHIQHEKNTLEKLRKSSVEHYREIVDPEYMHDENPNSIIKVDESEIGVRPYITEAEQKLLDEKNEEAMRRYRELMADDFPDRALNVMMNGVLEQRWEDEIKKDPQQPECLTSGKDPKNYTAADIASIALYEKQMKQINDERDRYFVKLTEEEQMIEELLEKQVKSFNTKVGETYLQKLHIEFCVACEELKLLRYHLLNFNRQLLSKKEKDLYKEVQELKDEIEKFSVTHNFLEFTFLGCRTRYEELNERNRLLDKQFKSSFLLSAPSQAVVDQAYRVFRRRPKWQMRAWQTAAILQDMAKRVNIGDCSTNGPPLPEVCFTHLEYLEKVDKFSNAPNLMDQTNWPILCKMRREKIEVEFKVRSCGALLAEAEASANAFSKEINLKRQKLAQFDMKLGELREEQKSNLINRSIQICLKGGAIEIPLTGSIKDFDTAVLLHESDVYEINEIIRKAGNKKLRVMESAAVFRRKIIHKEWQHKTLRIKMRNKEDAIKCIEKCKITKEVQNWLQYKQFGRGENISNTDLERERESVYARMEISCRDIMKQIQFVDRKILEKKVESSNLDRKIQLVNLDVAELNLKRNLEHEEMCEKERKIRLALLVERSRLVKQVQKQHAKILELTTMLELQRLKTYPTLNLQSTN
ncbi:cilia- and flagella-associated protein 43 [Bradysia coprophila]|uniref:cilia- and flagella-associated protein 43 n=1 Tax=Bradysia coprophila TaxID=38358 RepID=UPI00187D930C|nr:cilia- and flagella-associated protein 43 [Bradysia coprophila]